MKGKLWMIAMLAAAPSLAQVRWVKAAEPPADAVVAGELEGRRVVVCRGRLADGVHPGWFDGTACRVPQKGKVEHAADFEFAAGRGYTWASDSGDTAVVGGRQFGRLDLLVCRAAQGGTRVGKAYRNGPHTGHCYLAGADREIDLTSGFEILHEPGPNSR